jgi:hypothetical protein
MTAGRREERIRRFAVTVGDRLTIKRASVRPMASTAARFSSRPERTRSSRGRAPAFTRSQEASGRREALPRSDHAHPARKASQSALIRVDRGESSFAQHYRGEQAVIRPSVMVHPSRFWHLLPTP